MQLKNSGSISSFEFNSYSGGVEFKEKNSTSGVQSGLIWLGVC